MMRLAFLADTTGHLLYGGGLGAQPYWMIEALEILRAETARDFKKKTQKDK